MQEKCASLEHKLEDLVAKNKQLERELLQRDSSRTLDIEYLEKVENQLRVAKSNLERVTRDRD